MLHLCLFLLNSKYYQNEIWSNINVSSTVIEGIGTLLFFSQDIYIFRKKKTQIQLLNKLKTF